ncbi:MAG: multiheme c-type cytochrome [Planctomycetota bacterium]|nr:multiheme c-type cytochrome [Planctomycetota bacterium]
MELVLLSLAALAALVTLLWPARRLWGLVLLLFLVGAAGAFARPGPPRAGTERDPETALRPIAVREKGYVSSDTCRACHPGEYASWHRTFHRTMTQVVTPETVISNWHGTELTLRGKTLFLERVDDEFWVDMVDPEYTEDRAVNTRPVASSNRTRRVRKRAVLATGSHHQQVYWMASGQGRKLYLLPFTWLVPEKRWIPYEDSFVRPSTPHEVTEVWNAECIKCHSTAGRPGRDQATGLFDTKVGEFGIACEACHGPAEEHIRKNRDPQRRYALHFSDEADPTILNPAKVPAPVSAQICGQCHSVSGLKTRSGQAAWWREGFPYRPGADLFATRQVIRRPKDPHHPMLTNPVHREGLDRVTWPDGAVRVSGREFNGLLDSPCYRGGDFSCLTCHSMHAYQETDDQLAPVGESDEACLQCHTTYRDKIEAHTHHPAGSSGSRCYNCHMAYTTYGLFKAIRSHTVASPSMRESVEHRRPNACNLCHLDKTLVWTGRHLQKWYGKKPVEVTHPEESERSAAALWILRGDAGQRAIVAWHMGWAPALDASGADWMPPFLIQALDDTYSAVRFIAHRSLARHPGFGDLQYDFVGPRDGRVAVMNEALDLFRARLEPGLQRTGRDVFLRDGALEREAMLDVIRRRDQRRVYLAE